MFANSGATNSNAMPSSVKLFRPFFVCWGMQCLAIWFGLGSVFGTVFGLVSLQVFYCAKNDFLFSIFWVDFWIFGGEAVREMEMESKSFFLVHSRPNGKPI